MLRSLSILLPTRDGADRLPAVVAECLALAARHAADHELMIILDGADEATCGRAWHLAATHAPVLTLQYPRRRGFRHTLRDAWGTARGEHVLTLDPRQVPVAEAAKLLALANDHAAVFAVRRHGPAPHMALARSNLRELIGSAGSETDVLAELEAGARRRGLSIARVAVEPRPRAGSGQHQRARLGLGMLIVAGCLWLMRRLLPSGGRS